MKGFTLTVAWLVALDGLVVLSVLDRVEWSAIAQGETMSRRYESAAEEVAAVQDWLHEQSKREEAQAKADYIAELKERVVKASKAYCATSYIQDFSDWVDATKALIKAEDGI